MARRDLISVRGATWRFVVTTALTVLVLSAGAVVLAGKIAHTEAVEVAAHSARRMAQALGSSYVYADPAHPARQRGLRRLDRLVQERTAEGLVLRVKIWNPDGTVLYSDEARLIGRRFELEPQDQALFGTQDAYAEVSDLEAEENVLDRELARRVDAVVEVYAGFRSRDGKPLLFEAYVPAQDLLHHERELASRLIPAMAAAPVVAVLALLPTVLRLRRTLRAADAQRLRRVHDMLASRTEERRRLAREIHDEVIPGLAAAAFSLDVASQELEREESKHASTLHDVAGAVRDRMTDLRRMLDDLRTPAVARLGLTDALKEVARPLLDAGVDVRIDPVPDDLAPEETRLVYGLAAEGLRNVDRHADARHVLVRVRRQDENLFVEVHDDGRGLADQPVLVRSEHGLGLLADPLADLGGELSLRADAERGTVLSVRLPSQRGSGPDDRSQPPQLTPAAR